MISPVRRLLADAVGYQTYHLMKKSARYDDDLASELNNMTKKNAIQKNYKTVNGKDRMSIIAFLRDFKVA